MDLYKRKLRKKTLVLTLIFYTVLIGIVVSSSNYNLNYDNSQDNDNQYKNDKNTPILPQVSDYSSNSEGNGGDINVTLHQSLYDTTRKEILNTSDPSQNTFSVPSPPDSDFNSTKTYIEVEDLYAPNKTIVIQDLNATYPPATNEVTITGQDHILAGTFEIEQDMYLENVSIYLGGRNNKECGVEFVLFNCTWDGNDPLPNGDNYNYHVSFGTFYWKPPKGSLRIYMWVNLTGLHFFLNNSQTDNNTWAIGILDRSSSPGNPGWCYVPDTDGTDMSTIYENSGSWTKPHDSDFISKLTFNQAGTLGEPTVLELGTVINQTEVQNDVQAGTGNWTSYEEYGSDSGTLNFVVNVTEWQDVSLNVTLVQINYTKDLRPISNFKVSGSGQEIIWNVSLNENVNYFMDTLQNKYINFTIPTSWSNIQVWNGAVNKTDDIVIDQLGNGFQIIQVLNAGNGTNWFLNASSSNLLQSIDTYVGQTAYSAVNNSDVVHFNATFSLPISQDDGTITVDVYNPSAISEILNFTTSLSSFSSGTEISIVGWDISDDVAQCGIFRIQLLWYNDTAAGFLEKTLTISCDTTELLITDPPQNSEYNPTDIFNITVFFNDTSSNYAISGATINVDVNGSTYNTNVYDIGDGYYKIKINCSDSEFTLDNWHAIRINASKHYYTNQSEILTIKVTDTADSTPPVISNEVDDGPAELGTGSLTITCNVTDDTALSGTDPVQVQIWNPSNTLILDWTTMTSFGGTGYKYTWSVGANPVDTGYYYRIKANDTSNNVATTNNYTFNIIDTIDPTWDVVPSDQTEELGQPFSYDVDASDLQTITYSINDTTNFAIDANGVITNNTALSLGSYSLEINATDASNNVLTITITITVEDTTAPTWDVVPSDQTVELGQPFNYDVDASDLQTVTYSVNDTNNFAIDANGVITNNTILSLGSYSLQINATDASNNVLTMTITITVEDTTAPTWDVVPSDQTVELGQPFSYDVDASDLQTITYSVNDTANFAIDANGIITNNTALSLGSYSLQINATDASNNVLTITIIITVEDTTAPTWDVVPSNQTVELGQPFSYDVDASDLQIITYSINDTTNFAIDANGVITNNTVLSLGVYSLEINATDASNNVLTITITITVEDTTAPTWDVVPSDQTVELGQPFSYDVDASDLQTITYSVNDTTNFAIDANGLITNNTILNLGSYLLQINATDASNNVLKITITITVEDTTAPTWVEVPTNQGVTLGQSFSYEVNATDLQTITYSVNDTTNFAIDSNGVITNNTVLSLGSYSLEINATDASSNVLTITIVISVTDSDAPQWDEMPQDQTIELGTSLSYDLNATDVQTIIYSVNDTTNFAIDGNGVLTNNTVLSVGSYSIEVTASDGTNDNTTIIIITVEDTTAPTWDELPTDQTVELGQLFSYDVNATDLQSISYSVNDTVNFAIDVNGVITNNTILSVGLYSIEINASDASNNVLTITITVIVEDTTAPTWDVVPSDQTVELGQPFSYDVDASDLQTITYSVNDTTNFAIDANGVITNNTALSLGSYSLQINATDASNNVLTITILITVEDTTAPTWDVVPSDQTEELGQPFSYDVDASDLQTITYSVNDTTNFTIDANGVITNNTVLSLGSYSLQINATDASNNVLTITISITVEDTIAPTWDVVPSDQTVELGQPFSYDVDASDLQTITYSVNDTTNFVIDGNGVITNNIALSLGPYSLEINATDASNNMLTITIIITVEDTTAPTWDLVPSDQTVELGQPFSYDVDASDLQSITYSVNDTTNFAIDGNGVITNNTALSLGSYSLQINATDASNNVLTITIIITVEDTTAPTWDVVPSDQTEELGQPFSYDVDASDLQTITYSVNDTTNIAIDANGVITNNTALSLGSYSLQINATDASNNVLTIVIIITVEDTTAPTWDVVPSDQTEELGQPFSYDVDASDLQVITYSVNDTSNFAIDANGLITNNTALNLGSYSLQINATDASNNVLTITIIITVEDTTAPTWDVVPSDQTEELGQPFSYDVDASDLQTITYSINNTTNFAIDANGVITNNTALSLGSYSLQINATDASNNVLTITILITVEDTTAPAWDVVPSDQTEELGQPFSYDVDASDLQTITYSVNDTSNFAIDANGLITNNTALSLGSYSLEINATDASNNILTITIIITVQDTTAPTWVETPTNQGVPLGQSFSYDINATDLQAIIYSVNDTTNFAIDGNGLITNNTALSLGSYSLQINATDASNNVLIVYIIISVTDAAAPTWDEMPQDQTIELGLPFSYDLNATDVQIVLYTVNDTTNFAIDANGVLTNNTALSVGLYPIEVTASDGTNDNTTVIIITVQDTTAPTWDVVPSDQTEQLGQPFSYDVDASDLQAITYTMNDTTNFAIDANGVITNNTVLSLGSYSLQINATDASNNVLTITISITFEDTTAPTWDVVPSNQTEELGQSFSYDVDASDLQTITYTMNDTTNFAIDGNGLITNNTALSLGSYSLQINATDASNNVLTIAIIIIIEDTTAPTWDVVPSDQTEELGQPFSYDVDASDLQSITYSVNDTTNFAIDANGLITNNTALSLGSYSLEINATDASNNILTITITITVEDTTAPTWDVVPSDQTEELGQPFSYDVDASDLQTITYSVNDTTNFAIDANGLITNNTALSIGSYSLEINATDASNNVLTIIITITVEDTTAPTWDVVPSDQTEELGQPFSYDVDASDLQTIIYSVNDTTNFAIDANGLITNNTALSLGSYSLQINATDASNNVLTITIIITVEDITPPTWVETPTNQGVLLGQPFSYDVNATDLQVITYSVNDTTNFAIGANGLITNNTALSLGSYSLQINATDASNNLLTINIIISVTDTIAPTWDEMPQDQTIELGLPFSYDLNATDVQIVLYSVNDATNFSIDANGILTNNTILSVGAYPIEVTASDGTNDNVTIIIVTVQDTTAPTWDVVPSDQTEELGQPFSYDVDASDLQTITYSVNDTTNFAIDANGLITNNTALSLGSYSLQINATDASNNLLTITIIITVEDTTAPTWDVVPSDQTEELGQPFNYDLDASDLQTIIYSVNDTSNFAIDGNGLITNNTALNLGSYSLQINATDASNNVLTIIITITVEDTTAPTWDVVPSDQTEELGQPFSYDVDASDLQIITYSVNDTTNFAIDGNGLITNNTALNLGSYSLQINATDASNNVLTITIIITVEDTTAPTWDVVPSDQTEELGQPFSYDVDASDLQTITYSVNDTSNFAIDANGVITNNTALSIGSYSLEINATDASNNVLTITIIITVEDTTAPTWDVVPSDQTEELGQPFSYDVDASDLQTITYSVNDTSNFAIDANGVITNNTALNLGSYSIEINATDASNNKITITITITVEDTTPPTWVEIPTNQGVLLGQSFNYDINATDLQSITYSINDTTNFAINANGVITNNTALSLGSYSLQINATDASNNILTTYITISVTDSVAPTWDEKPQDQTVELGQPLSYDLNATDAQTVLYSVNDTVNFAIDANGILTNNTILGIGSYPIEVTASDGTNVNTTVIIITVQDTTAPTWDVVPSDQTEELGQPFSYDVDASDLQSITYSVNNTTNFAIDGNGLITNNTALNLGSYSLQINATDASNNVLTIKIIIAVEDTTAPTWDVVPSDQTEELGQPFSYDVDASDLQAITYSVNDTTNFAIDANGLITNNTVLSLGSYTIQINATDASNNVLTITIIITVEDTTAPTWDLVPSDQTVELGQPFSYDVDASDLQSITYSVNDTTNFAIDANGLITNNTVLILGSYSLQINATDASNNVLTITIIITVEDTTAPTWDVVPSDQTEELGQPFSYDVDASDLQTIAYSVNDTTNFAIDANGVITNNSALSIGSYSLEINATDASNNVLTITIIITVEDTTAPTWDVVPSDQTEELGQPFSYDVDASDLQTITYSVNDTTNFAIGASGIITNNTALIVGSYSLQINATDASNNVLTIIINIIVEDTTAPVWVEIPANQGVLLGQPFSYDVNATDLQAITYSINDTTNFAIDANGIVTNNTDLSLGSYSLQINATDVSNNVLIAFIIISVTDSTAPTWDELPQDQTIELGLPFSYDLNASDAQTVLYSVNDTVNFAIDANGILTNNTFLGIGSYPIEVVASDGTNDNTTVIIITVQDTTAPTWDLVPSDQTVELGQPFSYDVDASDLQSITYSVNDTTNFDIDANGLITNNTVLILGSYSLQINATDASNNVLTITIIITVEDTTAPTWDVIPSDQTVELGQPFSYDVDASDLQTITYSVNYTTNFAIDANGLITNNTILSLGSYTLQINATDASNNVLTITITITVEDTTAPTWDVVPGDQTEELGQPFNYDVDASDLQSITYSVNDTTNFAIDGNGVITNNTILSLGSYSLQINATDASNNVLTITITITVEDTTAPTWDVVPSDQTVELGQPFSYDVDASDLQSITYSVNDTTNFAINANGLITNNTILSLSSYSLEINATDASNNILTIIITITVEDTTAPIWDVVPSDQTAELGQPFSYDVDASDLQAIVYSVNDTTNFAIDANGLITNNTVLSLGSYTIQINATDASNNVLTITITITVEDTTPPTWVESPTNQGVLFGQLFSYDVNATDLQAIIYSLNDTVNFAIDANGIITNNTALILGSYSLQINATDSSNNVLTAYIIVSVTDTVAPTWDEMPQDQTVELGQPFSYNLNASDAQTVLYSVNDTVNFAIDANGVLTNNTILSIGSYSIEVTASDGTNDNVTIIIVTVQDTTAPTWDVVPSDQTEELGQPFSYDVDATDLQAIAYSVNDTTNFAIDANGVITNNTVLSLGSYSLQINATDASNNVLTITIIITVEDTTAPTWDVVPSDQTVELGQSFNYDVDASDLQTITYSINDTSNFAIDANGVITNNTALSLGSYSLQINATDASNNVLTITITITVEDTTAPTWDVIPSDQTVELGQPFSYDVDASDLQSITYSVNNTTNFAIDGNGLITNNTALIVGSYSLQINATDASNNLITITIIITVEDTTAPTWDEIPQDQTVELGQSFSYDVNATDLSGIAQYWVNDTTNFAIDGSGVITNAIALSIGTYWIMINASDPYGNSCSVKINITVVDMTNPPNVENILPSHGSSLANNIDIEINATITDDGSVLSAKAMINASVNFNLTMLMGTANNWTCTWNNVSLYDAGIYKITIWAIDDEGYITQTEFVVITITDVFNPSVIILSPLNGSTFNNSESIEVNATITDIGSSISSVKTMINGITPFNISMSYVNGKWTCIWNNISDYYAGDYKLTIWASDEYGNINQTEYINLRIIGLTTYNLINITQYNQLIYNVTAYEAYMGDNITVYMNFTDFYQNKAITGAFSNLTFNGVSYYDNDFDNDGIYSWEINTSQLSLGSYNFNVKFRKMNYDNISLSVNFDINKFIAQINIIDAPNSVFRGEIFNLTVSLTNMITGDLIVNENITFNIDFGNIPLNSYKINTSINGIATYYNITVPSNATKLDISAQYLGNILYLGVENNFSITLKLSSVEYRPSSSDDDKEKLVQNLLIPFSIFIGIIVAGFVMGVYVANRKEQEKEEYELVDKYLERKSFYLVYFPEKETKTNLLLNFAKTYFEYIWFILTISILGTTIFLATVNLDMILYRLLLIGVILVSLISSIIISKKLKQQRKPEKRFKWKVIGLALIWSATILLVSSFITPYYFSLLITILIIQVIAIIVIGAKFLLFNWHQKGEERISTNLKLSTILATIILLSTLGVISWLLLRSGIALTANMISILVTILVIEIISIIIFGVKNIKPFWHKERETKITLKWKLLIILTSTILLVGIGLWNWLSFSGMEATFIPFSILLIILTIEIISIIIIGLKLTKGQDGKEKISTEWKLSIIIAGIILLMTIGIYGRELLSGGTEFTGGLNIPAQLSLLILILMIEITSLVIMGIKIMKPNWHQVEKEKITTKWLVLTLFGVIILLTTIGIMGRLQFTGALNIPFIFSTLMLILISEIIMISFTVIRLLKPNWYQEGEEKKSTKWLILTLIFSIVLLMSIGISGWFLLKIIIFR